MAKKEIPIPVASELKAIDRRFERESERWALKKEKFAYRRLVRTCV